MLQGLKVCMISMSLTASIFLERNVRELCQFLSTISKPPRYNEKKTLLEMFNGRGRNNHPLYPYMFAHTVLTIDISVPSVLVGWECISQADLSFPVKVLDNQHVIARSGSNL